MNVEVERLLDLAAQLPADRRTEFLERECPDPHVRAEVESLLRYATGAESYFGSALGNVAASLRISYELSAGDVIGIYRIRSLLGRGGMGCVYLAERADGAFDQQVALKVVQAANTGFLLEHFQQERRILALLNHPNIARILDGGQLPNGSPYLVMEYVPGKPIDEFCEARGLSLRGRLDLFLKVCDAVRHAHQNLIVHRDLKPANILVTDAGEPKLLDFGIAKVLDPANLDRTSTQVLTPEYASPEQVRGDPITTATDIYSLGCVLFKLVCGRPPHTVGGIAPLEAARLISEEEAPAASSIRRSVPGDIDAILRKALHTDAGRRYRSVEEFFADIRRFLDGLPVLAAPDRFTYRARRFLARNALISSVGAAAILFLLLGSIVSIIEARRAQQRFQQVRQLANVFLFDFERSIQDLPGSLEARRLVASTAKRYLEQLSQESGGDSGLQREIAEAYDRLSEIQVRLQTGADEPEIASARRAYEIRLKLGDDRSSDRKVRANFVRSASSLAELYQSSKNSTEAAKWDEEATRSAEKWVASEPQLSEALEAARLAFMRQGDRMETAGKIAEARAALEKAVAFAARASAIGSADRHTDYNRAVTEYILANLLLNMKDIPGSLTHAQNALTITEQLKKLDPTKRKWRRADGLALSSMGIVYRDLSASDPALRAKSIDYLQRSLAEATQLMREDPKDAIGKDDVIVVCHRLARSLAEDGRWDDAAQLYDQAGQAARELIALNPRNRRHWYLLATNQINYGQLRMDQGHIEQGKQLLLSADPFFERGLALDPFDATILDVRATQFEKLAEIADRAADRKTAQDRVRQYLAVIKAMVQRDPAAKDYIGDYTEMLALARRLGVSTGDLH